MGFSFSRLPAHQDVLIGSSGHDIRQQDPPDVRFADIEGGRARIIRDEGIAEDVASLQ